jgi:hypothetical protein
MMRMTADKALALLPALQKAALALSQIEADATPSATPLATAGATARA